MPELCFRGDRGLSIALHTPADYVWAALLGALVAACLVVLLSRGRHGELAPLRVVLAG